LTGRSDEMRTIEAAISASDLCGIVVCGAAGVGKSRIVREALSTAASHRYECRWTIGTTAAQKLPLGAFASWTDTTVSDRLLLVRGVIDALTAAAPDTSVILGIDDAHLLDELSTFVLHQIVQRGAAKVVLTIRDDEPIPTSVREVWKDGQFDHLDLQPLSFNKTTELLSAALGGPIDPDAANRLWKLTRGNALYLRNIVEQELADGRIAQQNGWWRWIGEPVIPSSLVQLIESRFGTLPTAVGDVIDALAVGEPIELATLRRITAPDAIEEANTRGLITVDDVDAGVEVRVAHPLYGEMRRTHAPSTTLRRLRGLVANALAESDDSDDLRVVVRRATLSLDSDLAPDGALLLKAAQGAVWLADLALADRLATAAIRAGAGPEAYFIGAHALSWLFSGQKADALLATVPADQLSDGDRARFAYLRASNMLWALGEPARAKELIDDASQAAPPQARTWIDAFLTVYWFALDQPDAAKQASKDLVLDKLPAIVGAETAWALGVIAADAGHTTEAVSVAKSGYIAASRSFDAPQMRFNIADAHVSALLLAGRISEALEVAEDVRLQAADLPGAAHLLGAAVAGRAALGAGRLHSACALLDHAAVALSASGHEIGWGYRYNVPRATALAIRGSIAEAAATLAELVELQRPFRSLDYERSLARAWVAAEQGAVSEAIAIMLSAAKTAAANGQFAAEVMCLQTAAQFGDRSGESRLRELESIVEGPRAGLATVLAIALRHGDAAELDAVSEEFERMGDVVAAVDAAAHAAIAYRGANRRGSALRCSTRAGSLAQQYGIADTPALRKTIEPIPLTDREREVVMLIAAGFSSRAIAERLTLSVRTVDGHIYRAMAKTGTTSREELAALLSHPAHGRQ
jgi:DNA-binding CsgD family transcriptional regulator/peptidyl-tRNA hydrolase